MCSEKHGKYVMCENYNLNYLYTNLRFYLKTRKLFLVFKWNLRFVLYIIFLDIEFVKNDIQFYDYILTISY